MLKSRLTTVAKRLDEEVEVALRRAAEEIADEARARVPVNTGALKAAISVESGTEGYRVVAGDDKVWYGHIVERGGAHTPARPFLVPAFETVRSRIDDLIRQAMGDM